MTPAPTHAGIDLHATPRNPHVLAVCRPQTRFPQITLLHITRAQRLDHLLEALAPHKPTLIAVDAPLTPPPRRGYREQEYRALRLGARLLPPTLKPMRMLARHGLLLTGLLHSLTWNPKVVETHPTSAARMAAQGTLGDLAQLIGVPGNHGRHELEAITACWVATLASKHLTLNLGGSPPLHLPPPRLLEEAPP